MHGFTRTAPQVRVGVGVLGNARRIGVLRVIGTRVGRAEIMGCPPTHLVITRRLGVSLVVLRGRFIVLGVRGCRLHRIRLARLFIASPSKAGVHAAENVISVPFHDGASARVLAIENTIEGRPLTSRISVRTGARRRLATRLGGPITVQNRALRLLASPFFMARL